MKKQVYKGEILTRVKVRNNIIRIWEQSTEADRFDWYKDANSFASSITKEYVRTVGLVQACGVIAALSPMTSWDINKGLAKKALLLYSEDPINGWENMPCLKANARKAWKILSLGIVVNEGDVLTILKGDKVSAFFLNILHPDQALAVTIDRHALSIAMNKWLTDETVRTMTPGQYDFFSECYRWTALQLGINPLLLQSATWVVWRRIKNDYK